MKQLHQRFFSQDVLEVAPQLLGRTLCRRFDSGEVAQLTIIETEAYRGEEDLACHARFGRTKRSEALYGEAGTIYVYLIYGMYWLLNVVTGRVDEPQAVLIRGAVDIQTGQVCKGPGVLGRCLELDRSLYGQSVIDSETLWFERGVEVAPENITATSRIGVAYAGEWAHKPWRYCLLS